MELVIPPIPQPEPLFAEGVETSNVEHLIALNAEYVPIQEKPPPLGGHVLLNLWRFLSVYEGESLVSDLSEKLFPLLCFILSCRRNRTFSADFLWAQFGAPSPLVIFISHISIISFKADFSIIASLSLRVKSYEYVVILNFLFLYTPNAYNRQIYV